MQSSDTNWLQKEIEEFLIRTVGKELSSQYPGKNISVSIIRPIMHNIHIDWWFAPEANSNYRDIVKGYRLFTLHESISLYLQNGGVKFKKLDKEDDSVLEDDSLGLFLSLNIYDNRHWNYGKNCWEQYSEENEND